MSTAPERRILVVDDMPAIHEDFRKILAPPKTAPAFDGLEAALFGAPAAEASSGFELEFAFQGREALAMVVAAVEAGRPFALAFVDMRMPPGWDGVETIERLWQADRGLEVVICSANSDHPWDEVLKRLAGQGRPLVLPKPFDPAEVKRLAGAAAQR